jgi:hypothetical protein
LTTIHKTGVPAWFTNDYKGPELLKGPAREAINAMAFVDPTEWSHDGEPPEGWTRVGTATITVELVDEEALVANKIDSLRHEITRVRADAHAKETHLAGKIQQLLAITNNPTVPA